MRSHPFYQRLTLNKKLLVELIVSSVFINLLVLASPIFTIQVLTRYVTNGVTGTLITLLVGVLIAIIMEFSFRLLRNRLATAVCLAADKQLSQRVFFALNCIRFSVLNRIPISKRMQLMGHLQTVQQAYSSANISTMLDLPFSILFIIFIALLSVQLALVTFTVAVLLWFAGWINQLPIKKASEKSSASKLKLSTLVNASLTNSATLRNFNAWPLVQNIWEKIYNGLHSVNTWLDNRRGFIQTFSQNATAINTVCLFSLGALQVVKGDLNIGMLIGANILAARVLMPIARLSNLGEQLTKAKLAEAQIDELNRFPLENYKGTTIKQLKGHLRTHDMAFAYPNSKIALYEHLELTASPGKLICITGKNGTGKSTLAQLMVGLLEPSRGQLLLDNVDNQQLSINWLREQICYLPQQVNFLPGSILENIVLGRKGADNEALNQAVKLADLPRFLNQLPDGINTQLLESGKQLAAGIHKRIAIARAILMPGQICILDDAMESLDEDGQKAVFALHQSLLKQNRTVISFGNDSNIIALAHQIVDLNEKPTPKITTRTA